MRVSKVEEDAQMCGFRSQHKTNKLDHWFTVIKHAIDFPWTVHDAADMLDGLTTVSVQKET